MKFAELLRELRVPFVLEGKYARAGWINFHCPFCRGGSDPNKPYCGYNIRFGYVNCWRCGNHSVLDTVVELSGFSKGKCRELLRDLELVRNRIPHDVQRGKLKLPRGIGKLEKAHRRYLERRGFDPEEIQRLWEVKGIGMIVGLPWRLFIPILYHGETVSWTTRTIGNSVSRYISAAADEEVINHKTLLYGEDFCRHAVVCCEGPTDVWRIGPGAVATLGVNVSQEQILKLTKYPVRVICFDNESQAQQRAQRLCRALEVFPGETINVQLDSKDAGSATKQELEVLRSYLL